MKIYRLIIIAACAVSAAACTAEKLTEPVDLTFSFGDGVKVDGNVITVKKGEPVDFYLGGRADFVSFYSGEKGARYALKDRVAIDVEDIEKSTLIFNVVKPYGQIGDDEDPTGHNASLRLCWSTEFPGLSKTDFAKDSIMVEYFTWDEIPGELPDNDNNVTYTYTMDLIDKVNEDVTLAIWFGQQTTSGTAVKYQFQNFRVINVLKSGEELVLYADRLGLTPLNWLAHESYELASYDQLSERAYGTVSSEQNGLWLFTSENLQQGNFSIRGGNQFPVDWRATEEARKEEPDAPEVTRRYESWLISDPVPFTLCDPDQGVKVKDTTGQLGKFSYTYTEPGIYNATFLVRNENYVYSDETLKSFVINVTE